MKEIHSWLKRAIQWCKSLTILVIFGQCLLLLDNCESRVETKLLAPGIRIRAARLQNKRKPLRRKGQDHRAFSVELVRLSKFELNCYTNRLRRCTNKSFWFWFSRLSLSVFRQLSLPILPIRRWAEMGRWLVVESMDYRNRQLLSQSAYLLQSLFPSYLVPRSVSDKSMIPSAEEWERHFYQSLTMWIHSMIPRSDTPPDDGGTLVTVPSFFFSILMCLSFCPTPQQTLPSSNIQRWSIKTYLKSVLVLT